MKSEIFLLPEDNPGEAAVRVVESVPDGWFADFEGVSPGPIEKDRSIALTLVRGGYRGAIIFFNGGQGSYSALERCEIHLGPWRGYILGGAQTREGFSPKDHPSLVVVSWRDHHGGQRENVEGIIQACRALGLREYELAPAPS